VNDRFWPTLRSTGPKTIEGRAVSRKNALKHGPTARSLIIDGEHARQFEDLRTELIDTYKPQGVVEEHLVDMMAGLLWRLRRIPQLEAAAFAWMQRCHRQDGLLRSETNGVQRATRTTRQRRHCLGRAVFHLVRDGDLLDKLNRYETHLILQLGRIAAELDHQYGQRKTALKLPPLAAE
jgi:hypothetical protein